MKLLMLGGTRFVGRVVVDDALARGWEVTVLHRGHTGVAPAGADVLHLDRTDPVALADAVDDRRWDLVVDTWAGPPLVATESAAVLKDHVDRYAYVSSGSVYRWGQHVDECSPVVDAESTSDSDYDYSAAKRGAELGVLASFPDALLARAGLILGPHEDIGRLPWWLQRIAAGGRIVAPGVPDRPLQYVDARDAASFVLSGLESGLCGAYDVISPSGHATTAELLQACIDVTASEAELVWIDFDRLAGAGAQPWTHLPCWVPQTGEWAGFLESDTSQAARAGLDCRPIGSTVQDTWEWMRRESSLRDDRTDMLPPQRADRPVHGLPPEIERALLDD
ncbi:NAD-dependent epimerase/dehydratase family protein [Rhodococcus sovatensis]|uniref:NAD-dependent epimerase/dehydratase family protein n=1 Tax=Rhodococcus sovatensis TaxID=1805840 RepID=A0ABZ2PFF3_9NOCA